MVAGPSSEFVTEFFVQNGEKPFEVKIKGLKDPVAQTRIYARLAKVRSGTLGDQKALGKGLWELKVDYGPGYRVYFGKYDSQVGDESETRKLIILLLCGDKKSQDTDIETARAYWKSYKAEKARLKEAKIARSK